MSGQISSNVPAVRRKNFGWSIAVGILVSCYAIYFSLITTSVHQGFGTSAYDFGLYDQGIWLLSQGKNPFVTLMGRNLFGDHTSFILIFLVPLYWLFSSSSLLFVVQSVALAAGAIPVYAYARKALESDAMGFVMAATFLLHPAVGLTNVENFHPDSFLGFLIGLVLWAALSRRWRWYWVGVGLSLLVKEDVALIIIPIGIWVMLRRDVRRGFVTIVSSGVAMTLFFLVFMRAFTGVSFRNSWRIPFGGFQGLLSVAVRRPQELFRYLVSEERPLYMLHLLSPTALSFLVAPGIALTAIGVFGANLVSTFVYQHQIAYHYSLVIVPSLVFGTASGLARLPLMYRRRMVAVVAACALATAYFLSPLPGARSTVGQWSESSPSVVAAHELFPLIPRNAVVVAHHTLTAQLARRERIYLFPNPFERTLYGTDVFAKGDRLPFVDEVEFVMLPVVLSKSAQDVWSREVGSFQLLATNAWWNVYQRR